MKFKGFNENDLESLARAFSDKPGYETSTGYTGNKKTKKEKENMTVGKNRRRTSHLSNKGRKELVALHKQVDELLVEASFISAKIIDDDTAIHKIVKSDMKKGKNNNLGAEGIHSIATFTKYKEMDKTFVKYCYEQHGITHIDQIKEGMFLDFMEGLMSGTKPNGEKYSAKTIGLYKNSALKLFEEATKQGPAYQNLGKIGEGDIQTKYDELRKKYDVRYDKSNYSRGKNVNGKLGYSYEEARKIMKRANEISPLHGALYEVLGHAAPRRSELLKIKWRQVDVANNRIYLDDPNQNKNGRPRFVPIPEETSQKLQAIMDSGMVKNPDTKIWGNRMTKDDLYNLTKDLCRQARVGYSGIHDFRRAATEYHEREMKKELKKSKSKEELADRFMQMVNMDPKLNPVVPKMEKKLDENGKPIKILLYKKNGDPLLHPDGSHRFKYDWIQKLDVNNQPIFDHKYTKQEVMGWKSNRLINSIISQILGHNRTSATSPYRNG